PRGGREPPAAWPICQMSCSASRRQRRAVRRAAYPVRFSRMEADLPSGARAATAMGLDFVLVRTERPSSADESARLQGIRLEQLLRTIVVRRGEGDYVFVLVPGGRQIDWPKLPAHLGTRRLSLPDREEAREATGYERGAITPFGSRTAWPVVADAGIRSADRVAIGAGAHGVNLHVAGDDLIRALGASVVDIPTSDEGRCLSTGDAGTA